jgi:membrane-associated protease RseP (regulator of RpoE activity)
VLSGNWALPVVIATIVAIVFFHEFGHFTTAKWAGMRVNEFFVGFGPTIWSIRRSETEYGVKALLLGGYVRIVGMTSLEEVDPTDEPRRLTRQATYPRRLLVASAGSLMHLFMALLCAFILCAAVGLEDPSKVGVGGFATWYQVPETPAQVAGLAVGDQITKINTTTIDSPTVLRSIVHRSAGVRLRLEYRRAGATYVTFATPVDGRTVQALDANGTPQPVANPKGPSVGLLGVELTPLSSTLSPLRAVGRSFSYVGSVVTASVEFARARLRPSNYAALVHASDGGHADARAVGLSAQF